RSGHSPIRRSATASQQSWTAPSEPRRAPAVRAWSPRPYVSSFAYSLLCRSIGKLLQRQPDLGAQNLVALGPVALGRQHRRHAVGDVQHAVADLAEGVERGGLDLGLWQQLARELLV